MLRRNTSIKVLDLHSADYKENADGGICTAVAKGLVENSTVETLHLNVHETENPTVLDGLVWQEPLESNHCVKKLCFFKS
jgi:hypothetical protein